MNDQSSTSLLSTRYPSRSTQWQLRTQCLQFNRTPVLMAIVNVTPDSFSDGGNFFEPSQAVDHALGLIEQGAGILDIGGESTRPYSEPVSEDEELRRVIPVIEQLAQQTRVPISIDTSKAKVAAEAIAAGAEIINDVTGLEADAEMLQVAAETKAGICAMHMQGNPQTMQDNPAYQNVVQDIYGYLEARLKALLAGGIDRERICLDPGIGFGKTHQHNLDLLAACDRYHALGCPILVGHSRKGFIAKLLDDKEKDRTAGSVGVTLNLARQGIQVIRVHDVLANSEALQLFVATGGVDGVAAEIE
ncbi:MAG: dihydropteroate synthase [Pirellulales bacterium]|jgi:dihydropteroate synthase